MIVTYDTNAKKNNIPKCHTINTHPHFVNTCQQYHCITWTHEGGYRWYHLFLLPFRHISVLTEEKETCLYLSPETLPLFIDWERMDVLLLSMFSLPCGTAQLLSYFSPKWSPLFIDHINNKKIGSEKAAYLFQSWTARSTVTNICRNLKFEESNDPYYYYTA